MKYFQEIVKIVIMVLLALLCVYLSSCSTTHSFSINADSIEKPTINYTDSLSFQKVW